MKNSIRRNRNIGTAKQGFGQNNKLEISNPYGTLKDFYERLDNYKKYKRIINGHDFLFIVEQTRKTSQHACSIKDIKTIIEQIPSVDYGELKFIVLRQPKRKEETLSPSWGRLIYSYEFEGDYFPAIILDAVDYAQKFKWTKKLSINSQKELERLKEDGHDFFDNGKFYEAEFKLEFVRNTQLYRTLLHEFGHYVQYSELVDRPATEDEDYEIYEKRRDNYFKLPKVEKEKFAHKYADTLREKMQRQGTIPFDRKE